MPSCTSYDGENSQQKDGVINNVLQKALKV